MYFYIRAKPNLTDSALIKLWGHIIRLEKYGTFLVDHRHNEADPNQPFIGYVITEPKTGLMLVVQDSVKDAVEYSVMRLDDKGDNWFRVMVESYIKERGILNEVK